ncbi:Ca2+-binding RTX toxin-like protein [Nitrobacteraceae bacterium AZCC 2161]
MAFVGPEFLINSTTANDQAWASQTVLTDGRILVTWVSTDTTGPEPYDIRGRILNDDGTPEGSDFLINTTGLGDQGAPTVTALSDGRAFVAWQSYVPGDNVYEVRGSIVDTNGHASPDVVLNSAASISPFMPSATTLADGHILLTYTSEDGGDPKYLGDIRGRILNDDGSVAVDDFAVNTTTWGTQYGSQAAALPDGRALVSWTSYDPDEGRYNISGQFVNPDGSASTPDFRLAPQSQFSQSGASVAVLADGHILVAWVAQEPDGDNNIHARLLNPDGSVVVSDAIINSTLEGNQDSPSITALPDGRAVIVWHSTDPNTGASDLYGHIVGLGAFPLGNDFLINSPNGLTETAPHLLTMPDGQVLATWTSFDPTTNSDDIHGRIMSFNTITDGTPGDDQIAGTSDNDVIHGGNGRDIIHGADGNDALYGDAGNDQLIGDAGNDFLYGGDGNDRLWGGDGNDIFVGGSGADAFAGGRGIDFVRYEASPAGIHIDLTLNTATGGDANGDSFSSIEGVIGTRFDDTLIGDGAANTLSGGSGKDALDGRDGNDTLQGGDGNDALTGGTGNDVLHGDAGNDQLWGNDGDDTLQGGAGADALAGGAGSDTADYSNSSSGVNINLALGTAQWGDTEGDTLNSIENLTGSASSDLLTGDAGDNHLIGGASQDWLDGGAGHDTLEGGFGDDVLTGGPGADILIGNAGADQFVFKTIQDSLPAAPDQIVDFSAAEADQIDLSAIDANNTAAGDQAFAFVGAAAFTHTAGELRYADHLLQGDVDGNGTADFSIHVNARTLAVTDFHL